MMCVCVCMCVDMLDTEEASKMLVDTDKEDLRR